MFLKVISLLFLTQVTLAVLLQELLSVNSRNENLKRCISNVTKLNFNSQEYILYSHFNSNITDLDEIGSKYQMQVYNLKEAHQIVLNTFARFSAYVLVVATSDFEANLDNLQSMTRWNARAKFIIILEGEVSSRIWKKLIDYYVVNVIIIQRENLELFTYFPYRYENLRQPNLETFSLGFCENFDTIGSTSVSKLPKKWRNTTIIITYLQLNPYIIDIKKRTGIEIQLVDLMSTFFLYNVSYSDVKYVDWGKYYHNNFSYSGPVGAIQRYEADFVIGHFHLREEERVISFDTTFSYMDDDICWMVPIATIRSHWENVMNIFDYTIWWMTIAAMFLSYFAWQFFILGSPYTHPAAYRYYQNPLCSMEVPFLNFIGLPIMHEPKCWATRFLFMVISTSCFILVTGWKSYLIVSLTHDTSNYQIQNLKDIVNSGLILGIYHELVDLHCADGTPEGDFVCRTTDRNLCNAGHGCMIRSAFKRDMCTISTKRIFRYMSPQHFRTENGREMLYIFKECIAKDLTVQYYTLGHPLFLASNDLLIWMRSGGFVDNLDKQLDHTIALSFQAFMRGRSKFEISVLGMSQLEGMFVLLLSGLLASFVIFILELVLYKYRHQVHLYQRHGRYFLMNVCRLLNSRLM